MSTGAKTPQTGQPPCSIESFAKELMDAQDALQKALNETKHAETEHEQARLDHIDKEDAAALAHKRHQDARTKLGTIQQSMSQLNIDVAAAHDRVQKSGDALKNAEKEKKRKAQAHHDHQFALEAARSHHIAKRSAHSEAQQKLAESHDEHREAHEAHAKADKNNKKAMDDRRQGEVKMNLHQMQQHTTEADSNARASTGDKVNLAGHVPGAQAAANQAKNMYDKLQQMEHQMASLLPLAKQKRDLAKRKVQDAHDAHVRATSDVTEATKAVDTAHANFMQASGDAQHAAACHAAAHADHAHNARDHQEKATKLEDHKTAERHWLEQVVERSKASQSAAQAEKESAEHLQTKQEAMQKARNAVQMARIREQTARRVFTQTF